MKLKDEYVTYSIDNNMIMVSTGNESFKGMVKANSAAAFVLTCLKDEISEEELIDKMLEKYDVDRDTVTEDIQAVLNQLRSIEALQES